MKNAMRGLEAEAGEVWAYRARRGDALTPVTVVRRDSETRPERVVIRRGVDASNGQQEWVSPNWLKVPWDGINDFIAAEARDDAFESLGPVYIDHGPRFASESPEWCAVDAIFRDLVDDDVAKPYDRPVYRLWIRDAEALAELTGVSVNELTSHELTYEQDGAVVAPWPVAALAAKALAKRLPELVLLHLANEERELQQLITHSSSGDDLRLSDEMSERRSRDLRREWVGADALRRVDELEAMRAEVRRLTVLAASAIEALRRNGYTAEADRLRDDLDR